MNIFEFITNVELGLIYSLCVIGVYLCFKVINFVDMTCDGSFVLGQSVFAILIVSGYDPYLAMIASFICGMVAGFVTAFISMFFKISDILSGIITAFMLYSVNFKIMGKKPNIIIENYNVIISNENGILPIIIFVSFVLICLMLLFKTRFGLSARCVGKNICLSKNIGIKINQTKMIMIMISNGIIALSGSFACQYHGFCDISSGFGILIISLAALSISMSITDQISVKVFIQIIGCVLGAILYKMIISIALSASWIGIESSDINIITGMIIIAVSQITNFRKKAI